MQVNNVDGQSFKRYTIMDSADKLIRHNCKYESISLFRDILQQRYTNSHTDIIINNNLKNNKLFAVFSVNKGNHHDFKVIDQGFRSYEKFLNKILKTAQKIEDNAKKVLE